MNFEDLEAFLSVAELGGFSRAAVHKRVAQSALSRRVLRLEKLMGVKLLERRARGVDLTEHGLVLYEKGQGLLRQLEQIGKEVMDLSEDVRGHVTIAMPPQTAMALAAPIMRNVLTSYPNIRLVLREGSSGQIHDWIMSEKVDLALLYNAEEGSEILVKPLVTASVHLVVPTMLPPELANAINTGLRPDGRFRFKELHRIPLIMPNSMHGVRKLVTRLAAEHRVTPNIAHEVDGLGVICSLVEEGFGCTVFSYAGLSELLMENRIRLIPFHPPMAWTLSLVEPVSHGKGRAVQIVRRVLEEQVDVLIEEGFWERVKR
jgi:LysR family nitrogen assimilation transcriptional regulator